MCFSRRQNFIGPCVTCLTTCKVSPVVNHWQTTIRVKSQFGIFESIICGNVERWFHVILNIYEKQQFIKLNPTSRKNLPRMAYDLHGLHDKQKQHLLMRNEFPRYLHTQNFVIDACDLNLYLSELVLPRKLSDKNWNFSYLSLALYGSGAV